MIDAPRAPKLVTPNKETKPFAPGDKYYDPAFGLPPRSRFLEQTVRDFWRFFHGNWVNQPERRALVDLWATEVTDDDCRRYEDSFVKLFGDMCRMLPLKFLEGPSAWSTNLGEYRKWKHSEWIKTISLLQSLLNAEYYVPSHLRDIHPDFFESDRVPPTMVYVKCLPEMQEQELLEMLLSWFGMVWIGNPFILGVKILYEETDNHGGVSTGTAALRFATVELADQYIKMFHQLELFYEQYEILESPSREELNANLESPRVVWYQTLIDVTIGTDTRNLPWKLRFPLDNPPVRYRMRNKQESLMWQCPMPRYDFDLWHSDSRWLVNPNSGRKLEEMRVNNKGFPCYVKHPDVSFWEAVGHREGSSNGRSLWPVSQTRVGWLWESPQEYEALWNDDSYCDPQDAVNQKPARFTDQSKTWGRSVGGRAASPRQHSRHRR